MKSSRRYDDPCGIARALDRVGDRWALLVVRELVFGPKRFTDLRAGLPGASPNVLSERLDELIEAGVIERRQLEPPARTWVYELTPWGRELDAVLMALARWGSRAQPVPRGELSADALVLALRTTFVPARPGALAIELRLKSAGEPDALPDRYVLRIVDGALAASRAVAAARAVSPARDATVVDATITTDATTLRRVVFGDLPLADARAKGALVIDGNARAAAAFLGSFRRPAAVAAAATGNRE